MTTLAPTETRTLGSAVSMPKYELRGELEEPDLKASCGFQQRPMSVTLDGTSIFTLALSLVLLIHFLGSHVVQVLVSVVPLLLAIHNDYQNFINLGPGGTPSTFQGYIRITWLRLWALRDPFSAPTPDPSVVPGQGILSRQRLPYRAGPRPLVAGIAPNDKWTSTGRSLATCLCGEPWAGLVLTARSSSARSAHGEICHVHDSDHSMHMSLHPDDIRELLSKGWGQRHPLARKGWLLQMPVSPDFVMVYAPRNEHELHITYKIVEAAIWYTLAERVELGSLSK
ncbi:hypothetical protein ACCO45_003630 [Purpureocillium lilacinum]|uniref:Uncharacterized protein n=1 Tax=Purpureocillium lilacinum TaxID=33203 RepID=A0ACC4E0F2_PURLI